MVICFAIASSAFGMNKEEKEIIDNNTCLNTIAIQTPTTQIDCLCCNEKRVAFTNGSTLYVYDFKTGKLITKFEASWNSSKIKQLGFKPNFSNYIITYNDNDEKADWDTKNCEGTIKYNQFGEKCAFCFGKNSWYEINSIPHWSEIFKTNTSEIIVSVHEKISNECSNKLYETEKKLYAYSSNDDLCPLALYVQEKENSKDSIFIEIFENCSKKNLKEINFRDFNGKEVKPQINIDCEGSLTTNPDCSLFACINSEHKVQILDINGKNKILNIQCAPNSPLLFIDATHLLVTNAKEENHFIYIFNVITGKCIQKIPSELITSLYRAGEDTVLLGTTTGKIIYYAVNHKTGILKDCDPFSDADAILSIFESLCFLQ